MKTYADTSFLFSRYAADSNSVRADAWRTAHSDPLPFTAFHRLELRNAFSLAVFQQRMTAQEVQGAWYNDEADCAAGLLAVRGGLWNGVFSKAQQIAECRTPTLGTRTLDVIHIATAQVLTIDEFCTFDSRQSRLAAAEGLRVNQIAREDPRGDMAITKGKSCNSTEAMQILQPGSNEPQEFLWTMPKK